MPGLLMGLLQFGWLGVNTFGAADYLANKGFHVPALFYPLCVLSALGAAFVGLKGIQYVAKIATFFPVIPLAVLLVGLVLFGGSGFRRYRERTWLLTDQRGDQAGRFRARDHDSVAGEELVIGERIAAYPRP